MLIPESITKISLLIPEIILIYLSMLIPESITKISLLYLKA
jgi:hypothetical protein